MKTPLHEHSRVVVSGSWVPVARGFSLQVCSFWIQLQLKFASLIFEFQAWWRNQLVRRHHAYGLFLVGHEDIPSEISKTMPMQNKVYYGIWESRKLTIRYLHNPIIHLYYPRKNLHNHCLQFLLGHENVLREVESNAYAYLRGVNVVYYGICASSEYSVRGAVFNTNVLRKR